MIRILHINTGSDEYQSDIIGIPGDDIKVDVVDSVLEGIIASKKQEYDGIVFADPAEGTNGLDILNTLRQNEVTVPVLFNFVSDQEIQIYERGNRRRFDLETSSATETFQTFVDNLRNKSRDHISDLSFSQLYKIVNETAVPILVLNQYASIVYANKLACSYLKFDDPGELFNNSLNRIFPLKSALSGRKDIPALISERAAREQTFFWEISDREGQQKCVSVRANRINDSGPVTTVIQFLIGSEADVKQCPGMSEDQIVSVFCNSRIIRSGLELALSDSPFYFDFLELENNRFDEDLFVGSNIGIYACSHFNNDEVASLEAMISNAGKRPILLVSLAADQEAINSAMVAGIKGCIIGESDFDNVPNALSVLEQGGYWLDNPKVLTFHSFRNKETNKKENPLLNKLTRRETQVLSMLAKGMKNHDIAEKLELSYRTVVTHVYNIYRKLNLSSRTEAIHLAISSGLVEV